jgi:hypothetical protein
LEGGSNRLNRIERVNAEVSREVLAHVSSNSTSTDASQAGHQESKPPLPVAEATGPSPLEPTPVQANDQTSKAINAEPETSDATRTKTTLLPEQSRAATESSQLGNSAHTAPQHDCTISPGTTDSTPQNVAKTIKAARKPTSAAKPNFLQEQLQFLFTKLVSESDDQSATPTLHTQELAQINALIARVQVVVLVLLAVTHAVYYMLQFSWAYGSNWPTIYKSSLLLGQSVHDVHSVVSQYSASCNQLLSIGNRTYSLDRDSPPFYLQSIFWTFIVAESPFLWLEVRKPCLLVASRVHI